MIARGREELESNRRDRTGLPQKVIGRGYVRKRFRTMAGADQFLHNGQILGRVDSSRRQNLRIDCSATDRMTSGSYFVTAGFPEIHNSFPVHSARVKINA